MNRDRHNTQSETSIDNIGRDVLDHLYQYVHDAVFVFKLLPEGRLSQFLSVNEGASLLTGYSREQLLAMTVADLTPKSLKSALKQVVRDVIQGQREFTGFCLHRDGREIPIQFRITLEHKTGDDTLVCFVQDVTAEHRIMAELRENESTYRTLVNTVPLLITVMDADLRLLFINDSGCRMMTAALPGELVGRSVLDFIPQEQHEAIRRRLAELKPEHIYNPPVEIQLIRLDGTVIEVESRSSWIQYGHRSAILAVIQDITDRKQSLQLMQDMAYLDPLTNLPNRRAFMEKLQDSIDQASKVGTGVALLFLDLDRFKMINDSYGHEFGDELLRQVSARIRGIVPDAAFVARLGGDEFIVLLDCVHSCFDNFPQQVVTRLNRSPFTVYHREIVVSASVGVTCYLGHDNHEQDLLRQADVAMYQAKEQGGNTFSWYLPKHTMVPAHRRLELERGMHQALAKGEFRLVYQPTVDALTGRLVGCEALIRWHSQEFGDVPPGEFIPIAEETGLIVAIGEWVIRHACEQVVQWSRDGFQFFPIGINLSARQFRMPQFTEFVRSTLQQYNISGTCLHFEITERVLMENTEWIIKRLNELRALGVGLAIDDFGIGYSSLSYLKRFPIEILKIDQSFVRDLEEDANSAQIVLAIIQLAHSLGMRVTAEGVETEEQRDFLLKHQCDYLQGYLISRPQPPEALHYEKFSV